MARLTAVVSRIVTVSALVGAALALPPCTTDNIRATFTPCNEATNTMHAVQYFNVSCEPSEAVALAPPRPTRCDFECGSGTFYSPLAMRCENCAAGWSSNSGGRIIRDFSSIPAGFVTYCSPQPCNAWAPGPLGGMLTSGNQSGLHAPPRPGWPADESVTSELVTVVNVINPHPGRANFKFDYRVESEQYYDGLNVFINGTKYLPGANTNDYRSRFLLSGIHLSWRHLEIPLPALGTTEVRLVFSKDRDQASLSDLSQAGSDRAYVRDIVIEGVQMWAPFCTPCAPGTFAAVPGSMVCTPCPADTSSSGGSQSCTPCGESAWSPPGSAVCTPRVPCSAVDYVAVYGPCQLGTNNNTRQRTWRLSASTKCLPSPDHQPPRDETVPCAECLQGLLRNAAGECERCPLPGQIREKASNRCVFCPSGHAGVPSVNFDDGFDSFGSSVDPKYFTMSCNGYCSACANRGICQTDAGFNLVSLAAGTGSDADNTLVAVQLASGNGGTYSATLRYAFTTESSGFFSFRYFFQHSAAGRTQTNNAIYAVVRFDNSTVEELNTHATRESQDHYYHAFMSVGYHTIDIVVAQTLDHAPVDEVLFTLVTMTVSGDSRGAAWQCESCTPGTYCPENAAGLTPCPAGTANPDFRQTSCTRCPEGQFAATTGQRMCAACPLGTASTDARDRCVSTCRVTVDHLQYDLTALSHVYYGPVIAPTFEPSNFYLSVCQRVNHNGTSTVCERRNDVPLAPSYACQRYTESRSYSLGQNPSFARDASGALTFGVTDGDFCSNGAIPRSSNVTLVCDPSVEGPGSLEYVSEEPHCHYQFSLRTGAACPVCGPESFQKVVGQCRRDGMQEITYTKRPEAAACARGYQPPAPRNASCDRCLPTYLGTDWSNCENGLQHRVFYVKPEHQGCVDDGSAEQELRNEYVAQRIPLNQTCRQVEVRVGANVFTVATGAVLLVIIILVVVLVVAFLEFNKLNKRYQSLQEANADVGVGEMMREVPRHVQERVEQQNAANAIGSVPRPGAASSASTGSSPAPAIRPMPVRSAPAAADNDDDDIGDDGGEPAPGAMAPKLEDN